jgi:hypothetical protein
VTVVPARRWDLPDEQVHAAVGGIVGALSTGSEELDDLQWQMLDAIARSVLVSDVEPRAVPPVGPAALAASIVDPSQRLLTVHLMITLAFVRHPESPLVGDAIAAYASALDVDEPMVHAAREFTEHHAALLYFDIERNCEFTEETKRRALHGHLWRVLRNKLAYSGIAPDHEIAQRWEALDDCAEGTWGHELARFYHEHEFPFPGERHGISEVGARHDWIHVLADYDATAEGEIDVFAFIAASMPDPRGFAQFVMTLGLFQNDSIHHVAGKRVAMARTDTLADPGAVSRWADAMHRGALCTADVMHLDHFAFRDEQLDGLRERFGLIPKQSAR